MVKLITEILKWLPKELMPAGPLLRGKFHPKEAVLIPWFSISLGEQVFLQFSFLREQLGKNLDAET